MKKKLTRKAWDRAILAMEREALLKQTKLDLEEAKKKKQKQEAEFSKKKIDAFDKLDVYEILTTDSHNTIKLKNIKDERKFYNNSEKIFYIFEKNKSDKCSIFNFVTNFKKIIGDINVKITFIKEIFNNVVIIKNTNITKKMDEFIGNLNAFYYENFFIKENIEILNLIHNEKVYKLMGQKKENDFLLKYNSLKENDLKEQVVDNIMLDGGDDEEDEEEEESMQLPLEATTSTTTTIEKDVSKCLKEFAASKTFECCVCLKNNQKLENFKFLSDCSHTVCLTCMSTMEYEGSNSPIKCVVCRKVSRYIVNMYFVGDRSYFQVYGNQPHCVYISSSPSSSESEDEN